MPKNLYVTISYSNPQSRKEWPDCWSLRINQSTGQNAMICQLCRTPTNYSLQRRAERKVNPLVPSIILSSSRLQELHSAVAPLLLSKPIRQIHLVHEIMNQSCYSARSIVGCWQKSRRTVQFQAWNFIGLPEGPLSTNTKHKSFPLKKIKFSSHINGNTCHFQKRSNRQIQNQPLLMQSRNVKTTLKICLLVQTLNSTASVFTASLWSHITFNFQWPCSNDLCIISHIAELLWMFSGEQGTPTDWGTV